MESQISLNIESDIQCICYIERLFLFTCNIKGQSLRMNEQDREKYFPKVVFNRGKITKHEWMNEWMY